MNIALTKHLEDLIERILKTGRYNNASEVVRAALRELEKKEFADYLNPPPLPARTLAKIYSRESKADRDCEARRVRRSLGKREAR